jgi:regulator of protease activity HflC (stomatin/prohibitin superfamily)
MSSPPQQIKSFVENSIRSITPDMELDHLFTEKDRVAKGILSDLSHRMADLGYTITDTLIVDIEPEQKVKEAMNRITEAKRLREAAEYEAETEKLVLIKKAEAESQSKRLQGEGVAAQRKAILHGMQEGVEGLAAAMKLPSEELLKYTMLTQYFDMLRDVGTSANKSTVFIPHLPGTVNSLSEQLGSSILQSSVAAKTMDK